MQHKTVYLLTCKFTVHVLGVNHTHNQEYTKLKLQPPVLVQLPPSIVTKRLATLEGGNCTKNMTSTRGCTYSSVYS